MHLDIRNVNLKLGIVLRWTIFLMFALSLYEVIARYIFNSPTSWSFEMTEFIFGAWIFLGGGYTLLRGGHVNMDALYNSVSSKRRIKFALDTVAFVVTSIFCVILTWQSGVIAWESIRTLETTPSAWGPPYYPFKAVLPVGAILLGLQGIFKYLEDIKSLRKERIE